MTDAHTPSRREWAEPTSRMRLRWGRYRLRWILGLALIIIGIGCVQLTSTYSLPFLLVGMLVQLAGWIAQPTSVARRVAVVFPALGISALLLAGPSFSGFFAVPLGCWLLVRYRPPLSWVVIALPIASGLVITNSLFYYNQSWISYTVSTIVVVVSAWLAREIARWTSNRRAQSRAVGSTS